MMRIVWFIFLFASLIFSPAIAGESKSDWTDPKAIQFAEDLFFLFETVAKEAGSSVRVSIDSHPVRDGFQRILEFKFPDDRIILVEIHRDIAGEDTAWLKPISVFQSYFEKMH